MALPNKPYIGDQTPNQPFHSPEVPATFDRLFGSLVPNIQLDPEPGAADAWVRPSDWLAMPYVSPTEEKLVGLFAVFNTPENFIAVKFEGNYTVDWGDGTSTNHSSGQKAQHSYAWASISPSTLTSQGYKQVIVTVTPQTNQHLSVLDLSARHNNVRTNSDSSSPWLDLTISLPYADATDSVVLGGSSGYLVDLERVRVLNSGNLTNFGGLFEGSSALESVEILDSSLVTDMSGMFVGCYSLKSVPLFDTSSVTDMGGMFISCISLTSVPLFDTSSVTNMNSMFGGMGIGCILLKTVPLFDTSSVTDMQDMFGVCISLQSVPLFDTSSVTNMGFMFGFCASLQSIPLFDTSAVEGMNGMFSGCSSLKTIPQLDTSSVTDLYEIFYDCISLETVPQLNTSSATVLTGAFTSCPALQTAALAGTSVAVSYRYCLLGRSAIVSIFNGLANASATIDVRNNYGVSTLTSGDRAIATGKGWTVLS